MLVFPLKHKPSQLALGEKPDYISYLPTHISATTFLYRTTPFRNCLATIPVAALAITRTVLSVKINI